VPNPKCRPGRRLQQHGLDDLNEWTREFSALPKVAGLIVEQKTMHPNPRFAESHGIDTAGNGWLDWWIDQANRSIRYDWSGFLAGQASWPGLSTEKLQFVQEGTPAVVPDERDILRWLAAGQNEADILRLNPGLHTRDIRVALAHAAESLQQRPTPRPDEKRLSTLASRWAGKFELPKDDPTDPRLTYLLERYRRHRE
jgi:hypothetical protein